jgi:hypothetical protein
MAFAPQHEADLAYVTSAVACVVLLLLALGLRAPARWRRSRRSRRSQRRSAAPLLVAVTIDDPVRLLPLRRVLLIGLLIGLAGALLFAIRFGAAIAPLTIVLLLVGLSIRRLIRLAVVALAAVPAIYLIFPAQNSGGFFFGYPIHYIVAHWIVAGALCALIAVGLLEARAIRRRWIAPPDRSRAPRSAREPTGPREAVPAGAVPEKRP